MVSPAPERLRFIARLQPPLEKAKAEGYPIALGEFEESDVPISIGRHVERAIRGMRKVFDLDATVEVERPDGSLVPLGALTVAAFVPAYEHSRYRMMSRLSK